MTPLERALVRLDLDLRQLGIDWALIGGLAVSVQAQSRTTNDLDVAVAVSSDRDAERVIREFTARGYRVHLPIEHEEVGRLAAVRLQAPQSDPADPILVDLMFASSGIEREVVAAARPLEMPPGIVLPVATRGHLMAMKTLANRPRDETDFGALDSVASEEDRRQAVAAIELIERRGYHRGLDLRAIWASRRGQGS